MSTLYIFLLIVLALPLFWMAVSFIIVPAVMVFAGLFKIVSAKIQNKPPD